MDKIDILYRYYNDAFELSREAQKNRGKYFIYLCIIIAIQFMFIYDPSIASAILKALFIKLIDANVVLNIYILQTFIWVIFLYISIRYYQTNVYIERQYACIRKIENDLTEISNLKIDRESVNYLNEYPLILNVISFVYKYIFPFIYLVAVIAKILSEHSTGVLYLIDLTASIFCIIITTLYVYFLFKKHKK